MLRRLDYYNPQQIGEDLYRKVIEWPNPKLSKKSVPLDRENASSVIADLMDSFRVTGGLGLAAPQIGISKRAIIVNPSYLKISEDDTLVMINPKLELSGELFKSHEACFSIPYISEIVPRHSQCTVRFYNENWEEQELKVEGLAAACIQHEVDHLDGILFVRRLKSHFKRSSVYKKVTKQRKKEEAARKQAMSDFERDHEELMSGKFDGQKASKKTYTRKRKPKPRRKIKRSKKKK